MLASNCANFKFSTRLSSAKTDRGRQHDSNQRGTQSRLEVSLIELPMRFFYYCHALEIQLRNFQ